MPSFTFKAEWFTLEANYYICLHFFFTGATTENTQKRMASRSSVHIASVITR